MASIWIPLQLRQTVQSVYERHDAAWQAYLDEDAYRIAANYHPLRTQEIFHRSVCQTRVLFGGNRSGKTHAGAAEAIWHALGSYPSWYPQEGRSAIPNHGWIVGLDYFMVRDVIEPALQHFLDERWIADWNHNTHVIQLTNGSTIGLKSADSGRSKFQGTSRHWIWIDEECPEDVYRECRARIVDVGGRIWLTLTPLKGSAYLRRAIDEAGSNPHIGVFFAATRENARSAGGVIPDEEIDVFAAQLSPNEARCRLEGQFQLLEGRAYPSFSRADHVVCDLALQPQRELLWSWDFNVTPLCTVLAQIEADCLLVIDEVVLDGPHGHTTDEAIRKFLDRYAYAGCRENPDASGKKILLRSDVSLYGDYSGMARSHRRSSNDYEIIRRALQSAGWPRPSVHVKPNPPVRERVQAVERLLAAPGGKPRLLISNRCRYLIDDLEQVCWDARGNLDKQSDPKRTHASDALGYLVSERFPLIAFKREAEWGF